MIHSLEGKIALKGKNFLVLEINGVGYKIFLSARTLNKIPENDQSLRVFTFLHVKEDALELYGFLSFKELELFEVLKEIQGIGPKTALSLTSAGSIEEFRAAIKKGETKIFDGIKGIGQKKIQKIILELTGKFREMEKAKQPIDDPALDVLLSLGIPQTKAREVLKKVPLNKETEERVREALKTLGSQ